MRGFVFAQDSLATHVELQDCRFESNFDLCVWVRWGNRLSARNCVFTGLGSDRNNDMVVASESYIEYCRFASDVWSGFLAGRHGPHVVTNCIFGPARASSPGEGSIVDLSGGVIRFLFNDFVDCQYASHALELQSDLADSVEVSGNRFLNCVGADLLLTASGVVSIIEIGSSSQRGPYLSENVFVNCAANANADDIVLTAFRPALLERNRFENDAHNSFPSIRAGHPIWQPSPNELHENVFISCGYAIDLSAETDARFNYWGDPSGPYQVNSNPAGLGDTITGPVQFIPWLEDTVTQVNIRPELPTELLLTAYPNPFNNQVTLTFTLGNPGNVNFRIYDVLGREVSTIADATYPAGVHEVNFDAQDMPSGIYFARLETAHVSASRKLVLIK